MNFTRQPEQLSHPTVLSVPALIDFTLKPSQDQQPVTRPAAFSHHPHISLTTHTVFSEVLKTEHAVLLPVTVYSTAVVPKIMHLR